VVDLTHCWCRVGFQQRKEEEEEEKEKEK